MDLNTLQTQLTTVKPRFFDTYVLPGFMLWYAWRSSAMGRNVRRILFIGGVYMFYRNFSEFQKLYANLSNVVSGKEPITDVLKT